MSDTEHVKRIREELNTPSRMEEIAKEDNDGWRKSERTFRVPDSKSVFRRSTRFRKPE